MPNKIVQMGVRGVALIMLVLGMFFNSESQDFSSISYFLMAGVYGCYSILTLGLLVEAGLHFTSDKLVENLFLASGIGFNLLCMILAFREYYTETPYKYQSINKGLVSVMTVLFYVVDMVILEFT